ncbi:Protein-L-isoaspartate O-methyltransferase [Labilithrix luteola]|uniref:Protein-L-isoaspartate O-methyltransferase n=1 Tax=Labilithrix luteola TaxID=1391654 RepID=A0A0K1PYV4_9BACT|nr:Protein-L-isoaspartate O-methyltransferase [Labilithrix luteola]
MPVAYEIARALEAPLDVCVVRKIGAPIQPELGIGAVSEEGALHVDRGTMRQVGVSEEELADLIAEKRAEVDERVQTFRRGAPPLDVTGRTVIVVDDGVATGGTARAALQALRARGAGRVVLAVPVGASDSLDELASVADEIVCPHPEAFFMAVGLWYEDFTTTTDDDVVELLDHARAERERTGAPRMKSERVRVPVDRDVRIPLGKEVLEGRLTIPGDARGLVLFAHGSGSSRHSPRNQRVAAELRRSGLGTLLLDLLTLEEERIDAETMHLRFDIGLLAARLVVATDWVREQSETEERRLGYFGASTGAAAALVAAAERPGIVHAVVSRGGRPDLAEASLASVRAPTLLLVGGFDVQVLQLNREAFEQLACVKELEIVPGATHLFEEPGALEHVAQSAARWFVRHMGASALEAAG